MAPPTFMGLSGRSLSLAVSTVATTGFVLFGYDQGVMSGIISAEPFNNMFPATRDNTTMQGFVTAIYEIGCLFGAVFILGVGDLLGRRKAMILGGFIMALGVIIQVTAQVSHVPLAQFIVGRVVMGVGNGMNTSTIPTYQAECSRTANRGLLICIEGGVIAFGTVIAYWIDYGASYGPDDLSWRFPIAFQVIFAVIVCVPAVFLPESPRWLLTHERYEEANTVIAALRGYELDSAETLAERDMIVDSIRASGGFGQRSTPMKTLFTGGRTQHFRRMALGSASQLMQQIGGCNAVIYFFPILCQRSLGLDHNMSLLLGGINMIVYAIFATTSWFVIERVGRRRLFLYGTVGQMLSMVITFACLIPNQPMAARGAAVGLFTYIAFFGATWLPLPWLYPAELSPIKTRAKANAVSTCTNWLFNFLIVMVTPIMVSTLGVNGFGTYVFFAAINASFLPIIWFFFPETARRSLEEIDIIFAKGFVENISYVKAAEDLPYLNDSQVEEYAVRYGLIEGPTSASGAGVAGLRRRRDEEDSGTEKPRSERNTSSGNSIDNDAIVPNRDHERGGEAGLGDGLNMTEKADRS